MRMPLTLPLLLATSLAGCDADVPAEERAATGSELNAQGETLWPIKGGSAKIEVCWGDLSDPTVLAEAESIIERCVSNNVLHELGHLAGFAHEQYRADGAETQRACLDRIVAAGLESVDDLQNIPKSALGNAPLGPFDPESIMSYCRTDKSATLSALDVEMVARAYGGKGKAVKPPSSGGGIRGADGADGIGTSGGIGGKGGKGGVAL